MVLYCVRVQEARSTLAYMRKSQNFMSTRGPGHATATHDGTNSHQPSTSFGEASFTSSVVDEVPTELLCRCLSATQPCSLSVCVTWQKKGDPVPMRRSLDSLAQGGAARRTKLVHTASYERAERVIPIKDKRGVGAGGGAQKSNIPVFNKDKKRGPVPSTPGQTPKVQAKVARTLPTSGPTMTTPTSGEHHTPPHAGVDLDDIGEDDGSATGSLEVTRGRDPFRTPTGDDSTLDSLPHNMAGMSLNQYDAAARFDAVDGESGDGDSPQNGMPTTITSPRDSEGTSQFHTPPQSHIPHLNYHGNKGIRGGGSGSGLPKRFSQ